MPWKISVTPEEINQRCRGTLIEHLGIECTEVGKEHMTARMFVDSKLHQTSGILHGGASAALAETIGSIAANCAVEKGKRCVGLDLNINHIRAVKSGFVTAVTKPLHIGKTTHVWEILIRNEEGQLISAARLTIAVINNG